ncbi:hypothetical protein ACX27_26635 [Nostoc piscinale CENA21]|uniref:Uncharacterized protein n=1 Tax=Nostoc piscinale CENA21 TaxID=224013 RepID=A0A0M4TXV3_9NOSO|nr:hypothetical protein [Nostoc piscinale]ALF55606.1 hypothetical protein ACX27_26635 [Nostoc piscinale CENA21]
MPRNLVREESGINTIRWIEYRKFLDYQFSDVFPEGQFEPEGYDPDLYENVGNRNYFNPIDGNLYSLDIYPDEQGVWHRVWVLYTPFYGYEFVGYMPEGFVPDFESGEFIEGFN